MVSIKATQWAQSARLMDFWTFGLLVFVCLKIRRSSSKTSQLASTAHHSLRAARRSQLFQKVVLYTDQKFPSPKSKVLKVKVLKFKVQKIKVPKFLLSHKMQTATRSKVQKVKMPVDKSNKVRLKERLRGQSAF